MKDTTLPYAKKVSFSVVMYSKICKGALKEISVVWVIGRKDLEDNLMCNFKYKNLWPAPCNWSDWMESSVASSRLSIM